LPRNPRTFLEQNQNYLVSITNIIENPLYYLDKTLMLFGDARNFVGSIVQELTGSHG
jgi:hypothetical protein